MDSSVIENMHTDDHPAASLFVHSKRPDWGHSVLAWERDDKRGYQFEDGKLRVFKLDFCHMLEEVDLPLDRARRVLARLDRALGRQEAASQRGLTKSDLLSLDDQVKIFHIQHPDGFQGKAWSEKMRGEGAKTSIKRHRGPAIKLAQELLAAEALTTFVEGQQSEEVLKAALAVLDKTSLVRPAQRKPLEELAPHRVHNFAQALLNLLWGETDYGQRFDEFVWSMDVPCWELATSLPALVHPDSHVCIHPTRFKQQAMWMAPRLEHSKTANSATYYRYLSVALSVRDRLFKAELEPRDLLDIHDFILNTLTPSAKKLLKSDPDQAAA